METFNTESILRYTGKIRKTGIFEKLLQEDFDIYVEPFSGSFNLGLKLMTSGKIGKYILNDLDKEVSNFWECLKEDEKELISEIRKQLKMIKDDHIDFVEYSGKYERAATEFIRRQYQSLKQNKKNTKKVYEIDSRVEERFILNHILLQEVEIYNLEYEEIVRRFDSKNTLMVIDPPYHNVKNINRYYRCNSLEFDHTRLKEVINSLTSKAYIRYGKSEEISKLYSDFDLVYTDIKYIIDTEYVEYWYKNKRKGDK